jgi:hypothetical protein
LAVLAWPGFGADVRDGKAGGFDDVEGTHDALRKARALPLRSKTRRLPVVLPPRLVDTLTGPILRGTKNG